MDSSQPRKRSIEQVWRGFQTVLVPFEFDHGVRDTDPKSSLGRKSMGTT